MNRVKELRIEMKLSKTRLAKAAEVSRQAVMGWEAQEYDPKHEQVEKLMKIFGVDRNYILCQSDDSKEEDRLPPDWVQTARKAMRNFTAEQVDRILEGFLVAQGRNDHQDPVQ